MRLKKIKVFIREDLLKRLDQMEGSFSVKIERLLLRGLKSIDNGMEYDQDYKDK